MLIFSRRCTIYVLAYSTYGTTENFSSQKHILQYSSTDVQQPEKLSGFLTLGHISAPFQNIYGQSTSKKTKWYLFLLIVEHSLTTIIFRPFNMTMNLCYESLSANRKYSETHLVRYGSISN